MNAQIVFYLQKKRQANPTKLFQLSCFSSRYSKNITSFLFHYAISVQFLNVIERVMCNTALFTD